MSAMARSNPATVSRSSWRMETKTSASKFSPTAAGSTTARYPLMAPPRSSSRSRR